MGDAFSDVDLHIVVADEAAAELAEAWPELIDRIVPTVSIQRFGAMTPSDRTQRANIALVRLLLAEHGIVSTRENTIGNPFPFTKRLRSYLADEQNALLESLPPLLPSIDSAIDGFVALAEFFIPRARRLAAATATDWPAEYEQASVSYFERSVGVRLVL